jgi:hypothetical protein
MLVGPRPQGLTCISAAYSQPRHALTAPCPPGWAYTRPRPHHSQGQALVRPTLRVPPNSATPQADVAHLARSRSSPGNRRHALHCRVWLYEIKGAAPPRQAAGLGRLTAGTPALRPTRTPTAHRPRLPPHPRTSCEPREATNLRAADPSQEHPPASGPRQRRCASLHDDLRPPLTRPLRRALVLRYGFGGSPWPSGQSRRARGRAR